MKYLSLIVIMLWAACDNYPKDPKHTFKKAVDGELRVGYSENPPWVLNTGGVPDGTEAGIIKKFASSINAKIFWTKGSEQVLLEKLENNELDIVIAGFTNKTPWKEKKISLTRPYLKEGKNKHVIALLQGENQLQMELEKFLHKQYPSE